MSEFIFEIRTSEDGEVYFKQYKNEAAALKELDEEMEDCGGNCIETKSPGKDCCLQESEYRFFIRGQIVPLKAVEVVKKMTFGGGDE